VKLLNLGVELDEMQRAQEMGRRIVLNEKAPMIDTRTKERREVPIVLYVIVSEAMDEAIRDLLNDKWPISSPESN
jgi:hypothetical protein